MGMFDYIDYECNCPDCGAVVKGFQSKDGFCVMETLKPSDVKSFYSSCDKCKVWLEFTVVKKKITCPRCLEVSDYDSDNIQVTLERRYRTDLQGEANK